jgi:hypothetical protein
MSDYVSEFGINAFQQRWWPLVRRLLAASENNSRRWRLPREVVALPDHLLLDIGIDPRSVPNPAAEEISRPDLARSGLVPPLWRSTAKS